MDEKLKKQIIDFFKDKDVKKVELFGSFARDEQTQNSDIDLLIDFKGGLFEFVKLKNSLEEKLNKKVDLVTKDSISPYIWDYVKDDIKVIYEK